jgi:hypothetical protein
MSIPNTIFLPCNASALWDHDSDMGYRCTSCFAMVGSIGQPTQCKEEADKWKNLKALGGKGWDYYMGQQES